MREATLELIIDPPDCTDILYPTKPVRKLGLRYLKLRVVGHNGIQKSYQNIR